MVKEVPYELMRKVDGLEIRKYPPIITARITNMSENASFSRLFDYIQGANSTGKRVSMTAPVISSQRISMTAPVISDPGSFHFVMPDHFTLEDTPIPSDARISVAKIGGRTLAVLRFGGRTPSERVERFYRELMERVKKNGIMTKGTPFLMRYNSPFVPGPFRRNEAAVEIVKER